MNIQNFIHKALQPYYKRNFTCSGDFQKSVQVCILGAHTSLGRSTSFLLKQNPLVSALKIQGDQTVKNLAVDLNQIDTKCRVQPFVGSVNVPKALRSADIVLFLGKEKLKKDTTVVDRVMAEGKRAYDLAKECTIYAPRSIIIVSISPVSVLTPIIEGVFKETHWYHPGRIIGSAALAQIRANTIMGRDQDLDPHICNVPIIGGPDIDLAVPLFSRASPVDVHGKAAKHLMAKFRGVKYINFPEKMSRSNHVPDCDMSEAFALNNMITTIGLGLCGSKSAYYCAFVRTNLISTCRHLVTIAQFSRGGIVHNFGLPQVIHLEFRMFEKATLEIRKREKMAQEFLESMQHSTLPRFKKRDIRRKKLLEQKCIGAINLESL